MNINHLYRNFTLSTHSMFVRPAKTFFIFQKTKFHKKKNIGKEENIYFSLSLWKKLLMTHRERRGEIFLLFKLAKILSPRQFNRIFKRQSQIKVQILLTCTQYCQMSSEHVDVTNGPERFGLKANENI